MKYFFYATFIFTFFASCKKIVLGKDEENTPENNFDILWKDIDKRYGLFTVRGTNWDSLYNKYRPLVKSNTTNNQLWTICTNLIEHLDDSHVVLFKQNDSTGYISGHTLNQQSKFGFSKALITSKYLVTRAEVISEKSLSYGKIKNKNIGYIYLGAQDGVNPASIDNVVANLQQYKAIILDIRQNIGGDDEYAKRMAAAFASSEKMIYTTQTRNGLKHTDFDNKTEKFSRKATAGQFIKPVIVLTDRKTISAAEVFLIHMKSFNQVIQIGDSTSGDFSNISNRKFLPNGWSFQYSTQMYLLANGKSLDGIGHVPDVFIKNTPADIASNIDSVIEKAIDYLFNTYGIQ